MEDNSNSTPEQNTLTLTPGSDFLFNFRDDQNVWARQGSDTLLGFDPSAPLPTAPLLTELEGSADQFNFDILLGDFLEEDISPELFVRPDQVPPGRDTFILGDWRKPYYLDNFALGFQQIAIIADFQPEFDTIELHGSREDYILIPFALAGPDPEGTFTVVNGEALVWIGDSRFTNKGGFDVNEVFDAFETAGYIESYEEFDMSVKEIYNLAEFEESEEESGYVQRNRYFGGADIDDDAEFELNGTEFDFEFDSEEIEIEGFQNFTGNISVSATASSSSSSPNGSSASATANVTTGRQFNVDIDDVLASTPDFDIVGFFPDVPPGEGLPAEGLPLPDVDLDAGYFDFQGATSPGSPTDFRIKQLGTDGFDQATDVTTDAAGNFYVLGNTTGSLGGGNQGGYDVWIAKYSRFGRQQWIRQYGSTEGDVGWEIEAFTADNGATNFYVTGATTGNLAQVLGSGSGNQGYQDVWVGRFDQDGNVIRVAQNPQPIGGPEIDNALNIDVDEQGNLYQSGVTVEAVDSPLLPVQDFAWVAKYDSNGALQWFNDDALESTDQVGFDETYGVAVSADGSTYATGFTQNNLGGPRIGVYDLWLSKFDTQGEQIWIEKFGSVNYEFAWGVDTDSQNNAYVAGLTRGDLGGANQGENDVFLTKYDDDGNQQWIRQFGGIGDDGLYLGDITVDSEGNSYIAGFTDSVLVSENGQNRNFNRGNYDAWVAKYDTNGNQQWVSQFGSSELDFSSGITTDDRGQIYVTGYTQGSLGSQNQGSVDAWVTKVNPRTGAVSSFFSDVGSLQT